MWLVEAAVPAVWRRPRLSAIRMQIDDGSRWMGVKIGLLVLILLLARVSEVFP